MLYNIRIICYKRRGSISLRIVATGTHIPFIRIRSAMGAATRCRKLANIFKLKFFPRLLQFFDPIDSLYTLAYYVVLGTFVHFVTFCPILSRFQKCRFLPVLRGFISFCQFCQFCHMGGNLKNGCINLYMYIF